MAAKRLALPMKGGSHYSLLLQNSPFVAGSPSPRCGGPDLRLAAPSQCTIALNASSQERCATGAPRTGELGQVLAVSHFNDRPS